MSSVLFLSLVGPPDGVSTARLVGKLAAGLKERGHDVTVLTTSPHYNRDLAAEARQPISWGVLGIVGRSCFEGVPVVHVAMPKKGRFVAVRIVAWLWFHVVSTLVGLVRMPHHDVVLATSPPLTIGVSAWLIARARKSAFVYNVQEIYPDVAVQLGALRNAFLIRVLSRLERFVYARADVVTVISPGMAANLRAKGVAGDKLVEIPNFVEPPAAPGLGSANTFATAHRLHGAFVVTYAGNIGKPQGVEALVLAAELLREDAGVRFVIVGGGSAKAEVEDLVERKRLTSVLVLPYQPYESMPWIYAASSLCLVMQAAGIGATTLPSKAIEIVGAGRPILAVTDADSDLANFVRRTGAGVVVAPGGPEALAAAIREVKQNHVGWLERASAARQSVVEAFSRGAVVDAYSALVGGLGQRA